MEPTTLKYFVSIYLDSQEFRMSAANRIRHSTNDKFKETGDTVIKEYTEVENGIKRFIKNQLDDYPISEWLLQQRGIGSVLAGGLIAYIHPISRFDTVQKLWAYAGHGVMDVCQTCKKKHVESFKTGAWILNMEKRLELQNSKRKDDSKKKTSEQLRKQAEDMLCHCETPDLKRMSQRRIAGQMIDYNPDLKRLCYLVGDQFIKQTESPYRKIYDENKLCYGNRPDLMAEMEKRKGGISKGTGHINDMARRKTTKLFLSHLWETWRKLEGLPVPDPYSFAILGHNNRIPPFEYVPTLPKVKAKKEKTVKTVTKAKPKSKVIPEKKVKTVKTKIRTPKKLPIPI